MVMQVIVASSTIWLVQLIHAVQSGQNLWPDFGLFCLSLILPYFPGATALVVMNQWQMTTIKGFVEAFVERHKHQTPFWSSKNEKELRISLLTAEGQQTYNVFIEYIHRFASCALNVSLNLIVLAYLVEWKFIAGYLLSLFLALLLLKRANSKQSWLASQAQNARLEMGQSLLQAWDNVLLGNQYNYDLWRGTFISRLQMATELNVASSRYRQILSVAFAFLTLAPCFTIVAHSMWTQQANPLILSAFVVTLPRLFLILGFTHSLIDLFSEWSIQQSRLTGINQILTSSMDVLLGDRIQWDKIIFAENGSSKQAKSLAEIEGYLHKPCRVTLRGPNGCGKSSLLLLLKDQLQQRAFYLPSEDHLAFQFDGSALSTGQRLKKKLFELREKVDAEVLLLDEWDANLDAANQQEISGIIEQMSQIKAVLEIRHRE